MADASNRDRKASGDKIQEKARNLLAKKIGDGLKDVRNGKEYHASISGQPSSNKFQFHYEVEFNDSEKWLIHCRANLGDLYKEDEWNAYNIREIEKTECAVNDRIKKYYVLFSDNGAKDKESRRMAENHRLGRYKSYIDGYYSLTDMMSVVDDKKYSLIPLASASARAGLSKEKEFAAIMSDKDNFDIFFNGKRTHGNNIALYDTVMDKIGILPTMKIDEILVITGRKNIGSCFSKKGGKVNPKTDVILYTKTAGVCSKPYTFSVKRKGKNRPDFTVYQTSADNIAKCLGITDKRLVLLINEYQTYHSISGLETAHPGACKDLTARLKPYLDKFERMVLSGENVPCEDSVTYKQHANYLVVLEPSGSDEVWTVDEYLNKLHKNGTRNFGTVFQWTYQGKKGESIQFNAKYV